MENSKANIAEFFATLKVGFNKCLWPTLACKEKAINAHSVQNASSLGLIAENNHVAALGMRVNGGEPNCVFSKVGRNKASTFAGFCSHHDTKLFKPIDTKPLSLLDQEQLFLIAYRSVTRELHTAMESAMRLQTALDKKIKAGAVPKDAPSPIMTLATQHMLKAWGVWKHRYEFYDQLLFKNQLNKILHSSFMIEERKPVLASSAFFSVDNKPWGKRFSAVTLNVIPISVSQTAVVVSYPKEQSGAARKYVSPVFTKQGDERLLALSHLLVDRAENFFVLPSHVDGWTAEKRTTIESQYLGTILNKPATLSPALMLF
ncbi:hypothetical protein [Ochrobactrum chromiisoli]|uniref:Uncharacterized protein n=1 Tax=Ochrobactrum chromiisoli TaxID=2993941 RepID=A0ABT3QN94_9HYPH|nr:hypothetical protein [Ochrobactrum chromiisoli]MCX2697083.1 hypothetical protein [Ochrobactrum chromiisoli]